MGKERRCCRTAVVVWFDAPAYTRTARGVEVELALCDDMDLDDVVNEVLDELAYRWARAMEVTEKETVKMYRDNLRPYVEHYLASVLQSLADRAEVEYRRCVEGVLGVFEDADGYYVPSLRRGMYVMVSASIARCEEIKRCGEVFSAVLHGRRVEKPLPEELLSRLAPEKRMVVEPIFRRLSPHEEVLSFLQIRYGVRWWYTVFHSAHD